MKDGEHLADNEGAEKRPVTGPEAAAGTEAGLEPAEGPPQWGGGDDRAGTGRERRRTPRGGVDSAHEGDPADCCGP